MDLPTKLSLGVPVYPLPPGKILNVQLTVAAAAAAADSLSLGTTRVTAVSLSRVTVLIFITFRL